MLSYALDGNIEENFTWKMGLKRMKMGCINFNNPVGPLSMDSEGRALCPCYVLKGHHRRRV